MIDARKQRYLKSGLYVLIGILIIIGFIIGLQIVTGYIQVHTTPTGWKIIRPPNEVYTLLIDNDTVWTGGKDGVALIDRISGNQLQLPPNAPPFSYVRAIIKDNHGTIWIGHDGGLVQYLNGSWRIVAPQPDIPFTKTLSILERHDSSIVIGTALDVFEYNGVVWKSLINPGGPSIASADALFEDTNRNLWIGCDDPTHGALYRLRRSVWTIYTVNDNLPHSSVRMIRESTDGTIWVATGFANRGGIGLFKNETWTNITKQDGLAGQSTRSVYQDRDGRMWVGSEYDGIAVLEHGTWKVLTEKNGLAGNEVKIMNQDIENNYWLGTTKGLTRITNGTVI